MNPALRLLPVAVLHHRVRSTERASSRIRLEQAAVESRRPEAARDSRGLLRPELVSRGPADRARRHWYA